METDLRYAFALRATMSIEHRHAAAAGMLAVAAVDAAGAVGADVRMLSGDVIRCTDVSYWHPTMGKRVVACMALSFSRL